MIEIEYSFSRENIWSSLEILVVYFALYYVLIWIHVFIYTYARVRAHTYFSIFLFLSLSIFIYIYIYIYMFTRTGARSNILIDFVRIEANTRVFSKLDLFVGDAVFFREEKYSWKRRIK